VTRLGLAVTAALLWVAPGAYAQSETGYEIIDPPQPVRTTDKVEVLEYFWFGCPHCFAFEPAVNAWAKDKPDYVEFVREAPPLNPSWLAHSQGFYAAEELGITDKVFEPIFNAIHVDNRLLRQAEEIADFIAEMDIGVSANEFLKTMNFPEVETRIRESIELARAAQITGVPAMIINGKYRTGNSVAGSHERIIEVVNELSAKEHQQ